LGKNNDSAIYSLNSVPTSIGYSDNVLVSLRGSCWYNNCIILRVAAWILELVIERSMFAKQTSKKLLLSETVRHRMNTVFSQQNSNTFSNVLLLCMQIEFAQRCLYMNTRLYFDLSSILDRESFHLEFVDSM